MKGVPFYRFRKLIVFDDQELDDFEILISHLSAMEVKMTQNLGYLEPFIAMLANRTPHWNHNMENFKDFKDNHKLNVSVHWYETDDMAIADNYWRDENAVLLSEYQIKNNIGFREIS